jgi:diketogulonate reductase-like aldo/keto reductase
MKTNKDQENLMDYRYLGRSGFRVPALSLGTATFGGKDAFFAAWGDTGEEQATRLVDLCLDFGLNMFDSADVYSAGLAEEILGAAIKGKRDRVIISTKATFRSGDGPNDVGSSRYHLINACEKALKRLRTDYIDIFQLHGFDARTPIEETLSALDDLVRAGKIRYVGCSNFSGWHLMKSLAVAERYNLPRYVAHQAYYSLANREYESELISIPSSSLDHTTEISTRWQMNSYINLILDAEDAKARLRRLLQSASEPEIESKNATQPHLETMEKLNFGGVSFEPVRGDRGVSTERRLHLPLTHQLITFRQDRDRWSKSPGDTELTRD